MRLATIDLLLLLFPSCVILVAKCESFVIQPKLWDYKSAHIGYEIARPAVGSTNGNNETIHSLLVASDGDIGIVRGTTQGDPILLLNGFGVGSFHQHRLIPRLLDRPDENEVGTPPGTVYCMDYLGQGRSWPKDCQDGQSKSEEGLRYSAET